MHLRLGPLLMATIWKLPIFVSPDQPLHKLQGMGRYQLIGPDRQQVVFSVRLTFHRIFVSLPNCSVSLVSEADSQKICEVCGGRGAPKADLPLLQRITTPTNGQCHFLQLQLKWSKYMKLFSNFATQVKCMLLGPNGNDRLCALSDFYLAQNSDLKMSAPKLCTEGLNHLALIKTFFNATVSHHSFQIATTTSIQLRAIHITNQKSTGPSQMPRIVQNAQNYPDQCLDMMFVCCSFTARKGLNILIY